MAITPFSTPVKTEYKPLGYEAFAEPLSQMYEKLETTKAAVDAADFEISKLNQDDTRSKELMQTLKEKRDEIAQNLATSKNYTQAAKQLAGLQKMYTKDPELTSIQGNYTALQEAKKEMKEKIGKPNGITQRDYDTWLFKATHQFKGTDYDSKEESYNQINVQPPLANEEENIRKEALQLAGMAPEQRINSLGQYGHLTAETMQRLNVEVTEKNREQIAAEVTKFLKTSDKYKNWQEDNDRREWYYNANSDPATGEQFKENVIKGAFSQVDDQIAQINEKLKIPTLDKSEKEILQEKLKEAKNLQANILQGYETYAAQGRLDDFSEKLYVDFGQNKFDVIGDAAADIVDYRNIKYSTDNLTDPAATAKREKNSKTIEEFNEIGGVNMNITKSSLKGEVGSFDATGNVDALPAGVAVDLYSRLHDADVSINANDVFTDELQGIRLMRTGGKVETTETLTALGGEEFANNVIGIEKNYAQYSLLEARINAFDNSLADYDAKIALQRKKVASTSGPERESALAELRTLQGDKFETVVAKQSNFRTFENIIELTADAKMKEVWEKDAQKDPLAMIRIIKEHNKEFLTNPITGLPDPAAPVKGTYMGLGDPNDPNQPLTVEEVLANQNAPVTPVAKPKIGKPDEISTFGKDVMGNYLYNLRAEFAVASPEINMDERFDKYTNGAVTDIINYINNNNTGASTIDRVEFNDLTGNTKVIEDEALKGNFDLNVYEAVPHYVGNNQDGEPILRYAIKKQFQPGSQSAEAYAAKMISAKRENKRPEDLKDEDIVANAAEKKAWYAANPVNLYTVASGININPAKSAKDNYIKYGKAALEMQVGDPEAGVVFNKNLEMYANIALLSNPDTRNRYLKMGTQLEDAVKNNHLANEPIEPPAVWQQNPDGSQTGFTITYKVKDSQILMIVDKVTVDDQGQYVKEPVVSKPLDMTGSIPVQLMKNNLLFGTGAEKDAVSYQVGLGSEQYFVPAQFSLESVLGQ
jgi:hypothetical protein